MDARSRAVVGRHEAVLTTSFEDAVARVTAAAGPGGDYAGTVQPEDGGLRFALTPRHNALLPVRVPIFGPRSFVELVGTFTPTSEGTRLALEIGPNRALEPLGRLGAAVGLAALVAYWLSLVAWGLPEEPVAATIACATVLLLPIALVSAARGDSGPRLAAVERDAARDRFLWMLRR